MERTEGAGADLSQTLTYQHDERGRCQRIESSSARGVEIEQREYDEADRLKRSTRDVTIALLQGPASAVCLAPFRVLVGGVPGSRRDRAGPGGPGV
ncbi:MAG TPA: hypothetical protein VFS67_36490 [Polyangiaceae bacterium]|nr:hypothetical protein [Polyangiaceae bacterium]